MKNFSKTITAVSLSLLTIGAMAQTQYMGGPSQLQGHPKVGPSLTKHRVSKIASTTTYQYQLFYPGTDAGYSTAYSTSLGWFTDQLNSRFTKADTNAAASRENFNLIHSVDVAFDTLIDGSLNPYNATTVSVDTLWLICAYKNTSAANDTLVFTIKNLPASGLPTGATYTTAVVPIYPGVTFATTGGNLVLPGNNLDTLYEAIAIPNFMLPAGQIHFDVNVTFNGSKADTFELGYGFPLNTCSSACGSYDYANPGTYVGHLFTDTKTIHVNSYANGWQLYYSNVVTTLPTANGTIFGANNYEWNVCPGTCTTDTMFLYEQDYAVAASVTDVYTTGIKTVTGAGLSVSQNFPNPFNKNTEITYNLTKSSDVTFSVYDMTGRVLVNNVYTNSGAGDHVINLSANTFSPGVYFYSFNVNGSVVTKKMVITE
jgi:hypothetical protein